MTVDLTALDALAERATPGPWKHYDEVFRAQFSQRRVTEIQRARDGLTIIAWSGFDSLPPGTRRRKNHNAAFITAAVNAYAPMAAELRRLRDLDQAWLNAEGKIATLRADLADAVERVQSIIDWCDFAMKNPAEFDGHGVRNLDGPIFDEARTLLSRLSAKAPEAGG